MQADQAASEADVFVLGYTATGPELIGRAGWPDDAPSALGRRSGRARASGLGPGDAQGRKEPAVRSDERGSTRLAAALGAARTTDAGGGRSELADRAGRASPGLRRVCRAGSAPATEEPEKRSALVKVRDALLGAARDFVIGYLASKA